jgi:hypothetical protein
MRGVSPKVIQEQLGHTSLQMTIRYMHLAPDAVSETMAILDAVQDEQKGPQVGHRRAAGC